jgi:hypothetical protein
MNVAAIMAAGSTTLVVNSTSADDAPTGVGAHTLLIDGINSNGARSTYTVVLNGLTNVTVPGTWRFVNDMQIASTGGRINANYGIINAVLGGHQIARIIDGVGRSSTAAYMVPVGETLRLQSLYLQSVSDAHNYNARCELNRWGVVNPFAARVMDFTPHLTPTNLVIEELFTAGQVAEFTCVRYGNHAISFVMNARGYLLGGIER